ncbi:MAG: hypothetical protein HYZ09_03700, partial [Candidatus Kerfeldbacteria bacterium]|nr:hypothetical protein [Candidatus Kerfeldbacteria bacterium]
MQKRQGHKHQGEYHVFRQKAWFFACIAAVAFLTPAVGHAFTEPSEAPPGGAAAAPLNTSNTEQTKTGTLHIGQSGVGGGLYADYELCLGGVCYDDWNDLPGSSAVALNSGPTPETPTLAPYSFAGADQGYFLVEANDRAQRFAVGGQAPLNAIYPSSGIAGFAHEDSSFSIGVFGYDFNLANALAANFVGDTRIQKGLFTALDPNNALTVTATTSNSAIYSEQRGALASAYAGYFSGRLAAIGRTELADPADGQDSVLTVRCAGDGTRCFDLDLEKTGGFVWQTFRHLGDEKWWIRSDTGVASPFYFGIDSRPGSGAGETTTSVLRVSEPGDVAIAGGYVPTVTGASSPYASNSARLVVHRGSITGTDVDGGPTDALAAFANTTGSAVYAQQENTDASAYAGYFSGRTTVRGGDFIVGAAGETRNICLNGACISAWPAGGGGGSGQWTLNSGANLIFPNDSSRRVAIGGTTDAAPFFYDPGA